MGRSVAPSPDVGEFVGEPVPRPVIGPESAVLPRGLCWRLAWSAVVPLAPRGEGRARAAVAEPGEEGKGPRGKGGRGARRLGGLGGLVGRGDMLGAPQRSAPAQAQIHMYTPKETRVWQEAATLVLRSAWGAAGRSGPVGHQAPVRVDVVALFKRPQRPIHPFFVVVKPDRDNVDKIVLDSLVKAGVLHDDNAVVSGEPLKLYAPEGLSPRVLVWIYELAPYASEESSCR